jgi:hypothetical protein
MIEGGVQLVHRMGTKRIAHLRPIEGDANRTYIAGSRVGDVGEVETLDDFPGRRIEYLRNHEERA